MVKNEDKTLYFSYISIDLWWVGAGPLVSGNSSFLQHLAELVNQLMQLYTVHTSLYPILQTTVLIAVTSYVADTLAYFLLDVCAVIFTHGILGG